MTSTETMISTDWPAWSVDGAPVDLVRYVLPEVVRQHLTIPEMSGESAMPRLQVVWNTLRSVGIGYVHERQGSGPAGQLIRPPGEVLRCPRNATCLDAALVLAAACELAGLPSMPVIMKPTGAGSASHALVIIKLRGEWPAGESWTSQPGDLGGRLRMTERSGGDLVALDPNGITHSLGFSAAAGLNQDLDQAIASGHRYLTSDSWTWRFGAVARPDGQPRSDLFTPAPLPKLLPLRDLYRDPDPAESPLQLLRAECRITEFQSRDELTILQDLCERIETGGDRTGLAIISGKGGSGKTRLALELADRMRQRGWYAGLLQEELAAADPASLPWLTEVTTPLVVVVDYADARVNDVQALMRVLAQRTDVPRAVVVLTARSTEGDWLDTILRTETANNHPLTVEPMRLPNDHPNPLGILTATATGLRAHSNEPATAEDLAPVPIPDNIDWTTLDLVMLGWMATQSGDPLPNTRSGLYGTVLQHERGYWARTYQNLTHETEAHGALLDQAAASLSLLGPYTIDEADRYLTRIPKLAKNPDASDRIARVMWKCLRPAPGERAAIRPDPIGDHHILNTLSNTPTLLDALLPPGTDPEELAQPLITLTRAGQGNTDQAVDLVKQLTTSESDRWTVVLEAATALGGPPQQALEELVEEAELSLPLGEISARIPTEPTGLWRLGLLADDRRLANLPVARPSHERAELSHRVGLRRRNSGDRSGALTATNECVTLYRRLAEADPAAFTPDLAGALNTQAAMRSEMGDRAGALAAIEEAVTGYRGLAETDPATFSDLAGALNTQAAMRSEMGDRTGALAASNEAVALYRGLAEANPAAFTPDLATALNTQAAMRSEMGDRAGALAASNEAVALYRGLAEANPAAFTPDLATALNTQAARRSEMGDRAGALAASNEAVALYRGPAGTHPAAFTPDLATALNTQAARRAEVGDRAGALAAIDEAVALYRGLAEANPAAFTSDLAGALNTQASRRAEVRDRAGAQAAIDEAVALYRGLAEANPAAFTPHLALALKNQADRRSEAFDPSGALTAIDEAVTRYRGLTGIDSAVFTPHLAEALKTQAGRRAEAGDRAGSMAAKEEADAVYVRLAEGFPAAFTPDLAAVLEYQANWRSGVGDRPGAPTAIDEAVTVYRGLAEANPGAFTPDLAAALKNQAERRSAMDDRSGALTAIQEAVTVYRGLAEANPAAFTLDLAMALTDQAAMRSKVGDRSGQLTAIHETVVLYSGLAEADPAAFVRDLVQSTRMMADLLAPDSEAEAAATWARARKAVRPPLRGWLSAAGAEWLLACGQDHAARAALMDAATEAAASSPEQHVPFSELAKARQAVRSAARLFDPPVQELPGWAADKIADADADFVDACSEAEDWLQILGIVRENGDRFAHPEMATTLSHLAFVNPGDPVIEFMAELQQAVMSDGLVPTLDAWIAQLIRKAVADSWLRTSTWPKAIAFLRTYSDILRTPQVIDELAQSPEPVARAYAAILQLAGSLPLPKIERILTSTQDAVDEAQNALERADVSHIYWVTVANEETLNVPGVGQLLLAVLLADNDQPAEAARSAQEATIKATDIQRNANVIRLRNCAAVADPELRGKIEPLIKVYQNPPFDKTADGEAKS
jgi:hypothetical protein